MRKYKASFFVPVIDDPNRICKRLFINVTKKELFQISKWKEFGCPSKSAYIRKMFTYRVNDAQNTTIA